MKIIVGIIVGIVLTVLVAVVVIYAGVINMAANQTPSALEKEIGETLYEHSMEKRAKDEKNPYSADDEQALAEGLDHYRENCVICHGAPGVPTSEIGKGLNPPAPMLDIEDVREMSDGQIYWTVENGIRMTGMPAFGPTHSRDEIWKIVAFVRNLPQLTAAQKEALRSSVEEEEHHHHEEEESTPATQTQTQTRPHTHTHHH
jgi:mono/diheme cytochrome c family protein